jgi:hypothetical protein
VLAEIDAKSAETAALYRYFETDPADMINYAVDLGLGFCFGNRVAMNLLAPERGTGQRKNTGGFWSCPYRLHRLTKAR